MYSKCTSILYTCTVNVDVDVDVYTMNVHAGLLLSSFLLISHYKVSALGVLCCFALFVCLTLLASFFLPSHLSFKNMFMYSKCTCRSQAESEVQTQLPRTRF